MPGRVLIPPNPLFPNPRLFASALAVVALGVYGLQSCSHPDEPPDPAILPSALRQCPQVASADGIAASVLADPAVANLDAAAPFFSAAGCGSILLRDGWRSVAFSDDAPFPYVWVGGTAATFEVPRPLTAAGDPADTEYVLSVDAGGILYTGEPQWMELFAGERSLGRRNLDYFWKTVEIPVPAGILTADWNELRFEFAWARSPKDAGQSDDDRVLSAAVARIALRPRGTDSPPVARLKPTESVDTASLHLPREAVVTWPLPRHASVELSLPVSNLPKAGSGDGADEGSCRFTASLLGDEVRPLHPSLEHGTLSLRFDTGAEWSHLAVGWCPDGEGPAQARADAVLEVPPDALTWQPTVDAAAQMEAKHPDVFLYLVDTLRADALSIYGGHTPTPHVAELARDAVTYRQAWSASTWTLPATVSLLTGVPPSRHGVDTGHQKLGESSVAPLAERLGRAGYSTLGLSQSLVASPLFGLERGFDHFRLDNQLGSKALRSHQLRRLFLRYLSDPGLSEPSTEDRPRFVYLHAVAPHSPYLPTDGFERPAAELPGQLSAAAYDPHRFDLTWPRPGSQDIAKLRALYDGEAAWADQQVGRFVRLLRHLGLWDDALFVFTSDHGEEFGEHDGFDHGRTLFEEQLRVPLVVRYPGGALGGTVVERPVSTMDVVPTVLALADVSDDGGSSQESEGAKLAGRDLLAPGKATGSAEDRWLLGVVNPVSAEPLQAVDYVALRRGSLKCLMSRLPHDQFGRPVPRYRVFDLTSDPDESSPLPDDDPRVVECSVAWDEFESLENDAGQTGGDGPLTDEETLEELRALGYLGERGGSGKDSGEGR